MAPASRNIQETDVESPTIAIANRTSEPVDVVVVVGRVCEMPVQPPTLPGIPNRLRKERDGEILCFPAPVLDGRKPKTQIPGIILTRHLNGKLREAS